MRERRSRAKMGEKRLELREKPEIGREVRERKVYGGEAEEAREEERGRDTGREETKREKKREKEKK